MNPFTELKVFIKLQPIISNEQRLFKMKLSTSTITQILLGLGQALNIILPLTSGSGKVWVAAGIGIVQIVVNTISHLSNTDGSVLPPVSK